MKLPQDRERRPGPKLPKVLKCAHLSPSIAATTATTATTATKEIDDYEHGDEHGHEHGDEYGEK